MKMRSTCPGGLGLRLVAALAAALLAGGAARAEPCPADTQTFWAGAGQCDTRKGMNVGAVTIDNTATELVITVSTSVPFKKLHIYASTALLDTRNPAPGRFPFHSPQYECAAGVTSYTLRLPLALLGVSDCGSKPLYIAVHGEMCNGQTAWRFGPNCFTGGKWGWYTSFQPRDRTPPVVVSCPADTTIECGQALVFGTPAFADGCDPSLAVTDADETLPATCPVVQRVRRTWTASDECGNTASCSQTITVQDTTAPTLLNVPLDLTLECGQTVPAPAAVQASDVCSATTVDLDESEVAGSCGGEKTITRTWTATDACGNAASASQTITIQDTTPPTLSGSPANDTVECDAVPAAAAVTANDACAGNVSVTFQETRTDGTCPNRYTLVRTWSAADPCGNSASASQTITVQDTKAPVLAGVPADVKIDCGAALPAVPNVTATDACSGAATPTYSVSRIDGDCPGSYTLVRTWSATDACGNAASDSQIITVEDTQAPVISGVASATVGCGEDLPAPTATDNCDPEPELTSSDTRAGDVLTRTWTATDGCNSSTFTQTITLANQNCGGAIQPGDFRTQTQGGWGSDASGNNPGAYRDANFSLAFPNGLRVGLAGATDHDALFASSEAIRVFLPTGGKSGALDKDYVDPTETKAGNLAGQVVTLTLSVGFDLYDANFGKSATYLKDLEVVAGPFQDKTVAEVLDIANRFLAGRNDTGFKASEITDCVTKINENFVDGTHVGTFLKLP